VQTISRVLLNAAYLLMESNKMEKKTLVIFGVVILLVLGAVIISAFTSNQEGEGCCEGITQSSCEKYMGSLGGEDLESICGDQCGSTCDISACKEGCC
jgi:hypothetical protein